MKLPSKKRILSYFILFSIACGPGPLDFTEYFTIFEPEAAPNPMATQPYFYTNDYLNQQFFMNSSAYLADSLNIESWYNYTGKKISKADLKAGLYEKVTGKSLANQLRKIGKSQAAEYVLLTQEIDKETQKFGTYWEPSEPVNEQLLSDLKDYVLINAAKTSDDFLKERYGFQAMKINAKLKDWKYSVADYEKFNNEIRNKTIISEWSQSRYAGSLLYLGDTARSVIEFAKVFEQSPTRRNQADLSVRRLPTSAFSKAINACTSDQEKIAVYALQAIQPFQDGLSLMKSISNIEPNYSLLPLIMAREINKNEVNFYAEKNAGLYSHNLDVFDENYKIDSSKVAILKRKGQSYFEQLLTYNETLLTNPQLENKGYWHTTAAYLNYIKGDHTAMENHLAKAETDEDKNAELNKQIKLLKAIHFLNHGTLEEDETEMLNRIADFKEVESFRDNNRLVYLTEKLSSLYLSIKKTEKPKTGWLSSCFQSQQKESPADPSEIKSFLARHIAAVKEDGYTYMNGISEAYLLKNADRSLLKNTLAFIESGDLTNDDKKLIQLSGLNTQELKMAFARKLIRVQEYEPALALFRDCEHSHFEGGPFAYYFSPLPDQFILGETVNENLLSAIPYLEEVVNWKNETEKNPKNARAWYDLGLAAYNMSYWGNGWLFSDREWSINEIEYGDPSSEDYFTNSYAKECFEKALAANPEPELGAKICYMGAMCERNQYYIAYTNGKPNTYNQEELDHYRIKMETSVKPTFRSFFKRLKNQYDETLYESQVIKECISYVNYKLQ